ncbi:hypothetical protein PL8927_1380001 [Planktothrix serta PCC 8927]|uniref:Uncharacterized protein n=1 Tax=Planktothrix serta PCC 8927 TaxID=671068 RepID=A0A7Z9BEW2_9CYAN|nr:hypothetical protein PL8927_1380001 [Planktothrix serta PCC 8927]
MRALRLHTLRVKWESGRDFILEIRQVAGYNQNKSYLGNAGLIDYGD